MNNKCLVAGVIAFLIGGALGGGAGFYLGFEYGASVIIDSSLRKDAEGIQSVIGALRQLRQGEVEGAIGVLEQRVDDGLILFDPQEPYPGVSARSTSEVNAAVEAARRYRDDYPRAAPRPAIDSMVDDFLERGYRRGE